MKRNEKNVDKYDAMCRHVCVCVYINTSGCNAKIEQSVAGNHDYFGRCVKAAET